MQADNTKRFQNILENRIERNGRGKNPVKDQPRRPEAALRAARFLRRSSSSRSAFASSFWPMRELVRSSRSMSPKRATIEEPGSQSSCAYLCVQYMRIRLPCVRCGTLEIIIAQRKEKRAKRPGLLGAIVAEHIL